MIVGRLLFSELGVPCVMDLLSVLFFAVGLLLIAAVLFDAFCTAVALGGAGPITRRLAWGLWRGVLHWHRRSEQSGRVDSGHRLLASVGPVILLLIITTWILLLWVGFFLLFSAAPEAVVNPETGTPATPWERVYFIGFTVSTLGVGDFAPQGTLWRLLTPIGALSGFLVLTLAITYLVPVVSAVVEKRQLSASIASLGKTPQELLHAGWDGQGLSSLEPHLLRFAEEIEMHGQRHLAYPVLHFFHSPEERTAFGPRLAALSEALALIEQMPAKVQPSPASRRAVRGAIDGFLRTVRPILANSTVQMEVPDRPATAVLEETDLPIREMDPADEWSSRSVQRLRLLHALVKDDGWGWKDVIG